MIVAMMRRMGLRSVSRSMHVDDGVEVSVNCVHRVSRM